jgi:hypothetical protein
MKRNWKSAMLAAGAVAIAGSASAQSTTSTESEAIIVSVDPVTHEKQVVDVHTGELKLTLPDAVYQVGERVIIRLDAVGNKAAIQGIANSPLDGFFHS